MDFTPQQLRAIKHGRGHLQLIACAGSGKTEVVARRVANLLKAPTKGKALMPANIIAFTFTDKAAAELKERIYDRCRAVLGDVNGLAEMYVGTIHGFCLDLLKAEVPKYLKFEVLNDVQQGLFIDRHSSKSGLTACTALDGTPLKRFKDTWVYSQALSVIRESDTEDKKLRKCAIQAGLDMYETLLEERGYFDYSSIMTGAVDALVNDEGLRQRLATRVKHVIVDEYQDVNPIQEAVVWTLSDLGADICVVGDDDQVLYQWRGADVQNILTFAKRYDKVTPVKLEENFRSSAGVVETARAFIEQNTERLPKAMKPANGQPYDSGDLVALGFDDPDEEARYIAETCKALRGISITEDGKRRGISWSDMAVLLRSVSATGAPITAALKAAGVPYVVVGMNNLFDSAEANAARTLFYMMAGRATPGDALDAWTDARTGATKATLKGAIRASETLREEMASGDVKRFSVYSIQRQFLAFLENAGIREESVPDGRGEILLYNLGKFSQLISDFESIHYHSKPTEKYETFANFLEYRAEGAYPEGWQDNAYANPDAVRVMTVHQAKGLQWPVVFIPQLDRNRFPSKKQGGRNVWHLIPKDAVFGQPRYEGSLEDERRLFYVAMTRAQKLLHMTWAPVPGNQLYQRASEFYDDMLASKYVKRRVSDYSKRKRLAPTPKAAIANVVLSFSDLKYFFECPYQFKLRVLYGFNAPIHEALGYGKSLHDILAEVHGRAIRGDVAHDAEVPGLVGRHLRTPYAYPELKANLIASAEKVVKDYLAKNRKDFHKLEFSEKTVEVSLGDNVSVNGRIDLVRRLDTNETSIVDLKSTHRAQPEDVTETQLHIYALGYQELTGRNADYVEIYNLDEGKRKTRSVDEDFITDVKQKVRGAAEALRKNRLPARPHAKKCSGCDYHRMCSAGQSAIHKQAGEQ